MEKCSNLGPGEYLDGRPGVGTRDVKNELHVQDLQRVKTVEMALNFQIASPDFSRQKNGPRSLPEVSCLRLWGVGPGHETGLKHFHRHVTFLPIT